MADKNASSCKTDANIYIYYTSELTTISLSFFIASNT